VFFRHRDSPDIFSARVADVPAQLSCAPSLTSEQRHAAAPLGTVIGAASPGGTLAFNTWKALRARRSRSPDWSNRDRFRRRYLAQYLNHGDASRRNEFKRCSTALTININEIVLPPMTITPMTFSR